MIAAHLPRTADLPHSTDTRDGAGVPARASVRRLTVTMAGRAVVQDISLNFHAGQVAGLIGPNGSGKTSVLRAMAGLIKPSSGEVWLDGALLSGIPVRARARSIAYLPQFPERHPFTAFETVLMARYPHLGRFEVENAADVDMATHALSRTMSTGMAQRQLHSLSGGERHRVMLARVLAQKAGLVLLDEPTAPLDIRYQLLAMELARQEAARGAAVVAAIHDLALACRYCDIVVLLHDGGVLAAGAPSAVVTAENIRTAYGVEVLVGLDEATGFMRVIPLRSV